MILYLDTSALVKRYVQETGSTEVAAIITQADVLGSSALTHVEMAAALAKAARLGWVIREKAEAAWQDYLKHWPYFTRLVVTSPLVERASHLAWEYGLRGYDATHLAAALTWQDILETQVILATFDRGLWQAAQKTGLAAWPETL